MSLLYQRDLAEAARPSMRDRCLLTAAALWLGAWCAASGDEPSAETLAAALQQQLSSITSIDVVYEHLYEPDDVVKSTGFTATGPEQVEWAEQGDLFLFMQYLPTSQEKLGLAYVFDGEKAYSYDARPRQRSKHTEQPTRRGNFFISGVLPSGARNAVTPAFAIGRRVRFTDRNLVEVLRLPGARTTGIEPIEERPCYRVEVAGVPSTESHPIKLVAHLDPVHDYLPAKIAVSYDTDDAGLKMIHQTWEVSEFMRARDGAARKDRWFPKVAVFTQAAGGTFRLTVSSVRINENLPPEKFRINPPEGTLVSDKLRRGEDQRYISGGAPAEQKLVEVAADRAKQEISESIAGKTVSLDTRPKRASFVPWILLCVSCVFAVAAAIWFRSR